MTDKRMLILPADLVKKIDDNRGDVSQAEFIEVLIDSQFKDKDKGKESQYATKEELSVFEEDMKRLLRSFLDFFVSYGLELGKQSQAGELEELTSKLQGLQRDIGADNNDKGGKATIKWKCPPDPGERSPPSPTRMRGLFFAIFQAHRA